MGTQWFDYKKSARGFKEGIHKSRRVYGYNSRPRNEVEMNISYSHQREDKKWLEKRAKQESQYKSLVLTNEEIEIFENLLKAEINRARNNLLSGKYVANLKDILDKIN